MSDSEPILFRPRPAGASHATGTTAQSGPPSSPATGFNRDELNDILAVYGRKVAAGEWRDYAIDISRDRAVFSVFRRASERPIFRIEKAPRLERKQGAYSVIAATGLIVRCGHDLKRVLGALERRLALIEW